MSELLVLALKFAFLGLLWVFILFCGNVIRTDLFGRRVPLPADQPSRRETRRAARAAQKLPATLRITRGKQAGLTMLLGEGIKIGRSSDCQLILDDDYVSTRHARIYRTETGYTVEDLGSTNGTYLNEVRLTTPTPFTPADTLRIGRTLMVVES